MYDEAETRYLLRPLRRTERHIHARKKECEKLQETKISSFELESVEPPVIGIHDLDGSDPLDQESHHRTGTLSVVVEAD